MTDEQRAAYEAQGYLVIRGALAPDVLNRVRAAFDHACDEGRLDALPNADGVFIELAEHPTFFTATHRILGDDIQVRSVRGLRIEPDGSGRGWHREVAGMLGVCHPRSTLAVQAYLHLDDTPEGGSYLAAVPGSHRFKPELPFPEITWIEEMPHHVALPAHAGDVVVLHGNVWQARTRNRGGVPQRLIEVTYIHSWMRQSLPPLSPPALAVASSSHNLRQLFGIRGGEGAADGRWSRKIEGYPPSNGLPVRRFSGPKLVGLGDANRYDERARIGEG